MDERVLLSSDHDGVRTLTLNRPERKRRLRALALHELAMPTVAMVTGVAATPEARFCQAFAKRGLSVDPGGSCLLPNLVGRLAAGPPLALAQSKALANEARAQPGNFVTADSGEAYAAFAAKREPSFTGQWALPSPRGQERSDSGDGQRSEQKDA
jgi:hypothetical protein